MENGIGLDNSRPHWAAALPIPVAAESRNENRGLNGAITGWHLAFRRWWGCVSASLSQLPRLHFRLGQRCGWRAMGTNFGMILINFASTCKGLKFFLISLLSDEHTMSCKNMNLLYSIHMYWTNFWQPTVHVKHRLRPNLSIIRDIVNLWKMF